MSNQSSTYDQAQAISIPGARKPGRGFFRSFFANFFDSWLKAYGSSRVDSHGNLTIEL
jgi:hypothetical protein